MTFTGCVLQDLEEVKAVYTKAKLREADPAILRALEALLQQYGAELASAREWDAGG